MADGPDQVVADSVVRELAAKLYNIRFNLVAIRPLVDLAIDELMPGWLSL